MDLAAGVRRVVVVALLAIAGGGSASETAHDQPSVYYVRHDILRGDAGDDEALRVGYYRAVLQPAANGGTQVRLAPLSAQTLDGAGEATYLLDLDPEDADDRARLDVLASGFVVEMTGRGEPEPLRAADPGAWSTFAEKSPVAAEMLRLGYQAPGLRPMQLPASVATGDRMIRWQRIEPFGRIKTDLQIIDVTPDAVLMQMVLAAPGAEGEGRVVVRRSNGMPIELRMEVRVAAAKDQPATRHRVHLADMDADPMMYMADELESYVSYVEQINQQLGQPPFSAPSPSPSAYSRRLAAPGELESFMVGADALAGTAPITGAFWNPSANGNSRWLAIGARVLGSVRPPDGAGQPEPMLMARLQRVELLDADGVPIPGLQTQQVKRVLYLTEKYSVAQNELEFPFHVSLGTRRELLGRIEAVRMSVDAEVYAFESTETLKLGEPSRLNPAITLQMPSATRVTVLHDRQSWKMQTGLYSVVVPLDAQGNVLPAEELTVASLKAAAPTRLADLPLAWENGRMPMRTEIATPRPIARLQVRHYRWKPVAKIWTFPMRE